MRRYSGQSNFLILIIPLVLCLVAPARRLAAGQKQKAPLIFSEVSDQTGLKFRHYNGMAGKLFLPEIMGAGVALFDFDNDGDLDVFLVQGATLEISDQP